MTRVLHLVKHLACRPAGFQLDGLQVRQYAGPHDIAAWLQIREDSFAAEPFAVRPWDAADFQAEFLSKPWWSPERMWFAETTAEAVNCPVGTVALALRGSEPQARAAVHWLAVVPECRRRGVGRLLISVLEAAAWNAGHRSVHVETHAAWTAATAFYGSLGYR